MLVWAQAVVRKELKEVLQGTNVWNAEKTDHYSPHSRCVHLFAVDGDSLRATAVLKRHRAPVTCVGLEPIETPVGSSGPKLNVRNLYWIEGAY